MTEKGLLPKPAEIRSVAEKMRLGGVVGSRETDGCR